MNVARSQRLNQPSSEDKRRQWTVLTSPDRAGLVDNVDNLELTPQDSFPTPECYNFKSEVEVLTNSICVPFRIFCSSQSNIMHMLLDVFCQSALNSL